MRFTATLVLVSCLAAPAFADEKLDKEIEKAQKDFDKGDREKALKRLDKYADKNTSVDSLLALARMQERVASYNGGGTEAAALTAARAVASSSGPAKARALAAQSRYELLRGAGGKALEHANQAVSTDANAAALAALARAQVRVQDLKSAMESADKAVAADARSADAHAARGAALLALGRAEAAAEAYRQAVQLDPSDVDAHAGLGLALSEAGQHDAAIAAAQKATQLNDQSSTAFAVLGLAHMAKAPEDATALGEAINHASQGKFLNERNVFAQLAVGRIFSARGNFQQATAAYEAASKIDPGYVPTQVALIRQRIAQKDMAGAVRDADALVAASPRSALAHLQHGRTLLRAGRFPDALAALEKATQLAPDMAEAQAMLGTAYQYNRRSSDARRAYERATSLDTSNVEYKVTYGLLLGLDGEHARGIEVLEPVVANASYDKADAWVNLGWLYRNAKPKRAADSVRAYEKALQIDTDNADAALGLGWAYTYVRPRAWDRAVAAFEKAIELNSALAGEAHSGIAWCHFFQQDFERARASIESARDAGKVDRRLVANLQRVQTEKQAQEVLAAYEQLVEGMSYEQVQGVLGRPGEETERVDSEVTYQWENPDGTYIVVVFEADKLVDMIHTGLEPAEEEGATAEAAQEDAVDTETCG